MERVWSHYTLSLTFSLALDKYCNNSHFLVSIEDNHLTPTMPRPSEASCAICMDSLFNAKDDLNDVLAVTAPDCGA
jgi:hypothetical protein